MDEQHEPTEQEIKEVIRDSQVLAHRLVDVMNEERPVVQGGALAMLLAMLMKRDVVDNDCFGSVQEFIDHYQEGAEMMLETIVATEKAGEIQQCGTGSMTRTIPCSGSFGPGGKPLGSCKTVGAL